MKWNYKKPEDYVSPIKVYCSNCDEWHNESSVEINGIEEDFLGQDVLSFNCPICEERQKSLRRG